MVLIPAVLAGIAAGFALSRWQKRSWKPPDLRFLWLVVISFLPQLLAFYLPATRDRVTDELASAGLILSQTMLLGFCWLNRKLPGMWLLASGTACNLLAIVANGGFMPISPQTAEVLVRANVLDGIGLGNRFGIKDILLLPEQTRFFFLSDCFLSPEVIPYRFAFSLGDIFIGSGIFWLLMVGGTSPRSNHVPREENKC